MSASLYSAITLLTLMLLMIISASSVSLSSSGLAHTNSLDHPDLSVHNILPSYRTEVKHCYQCAYSPPRPHSARRSKTGAKSQKKNSRSVAKDRLSKGGWDKCLGPFTASEATEYGVDVWKCRSYCYTRRDPNGDIFRGCYKGEYGVDPSLFGCHRQADSMYCFCDGDRCNHQQAPPEDDLKKFLP